MEKPDVLVKQLGEPDTQAFVVHINRTKKATKERTLPGPTSPTDSNIPLAHYLRPGHQINPILPVSGSYGKGIGTPATAHNGTPAPTPLFPPKSKLNCWEFTLNDDGCIGPYTPPPSPFTTMFPP